MKKIPLILLFFALNLQAVSLHAEPLLKDGDRMVFCGDSITDMKLYTRYVMDYFALRHPGEKIVFYNVGITGSTTGGWVKGGIAQHVLTHRPTVVSICLGMNDGQYRAYDEKIASTYEANLTTLVQQIKAGGAKVVLLTPGVIDDDTIAASRGKGIYNDTLKQLAARVEKIAARENVPVFDLHNLMLGVQTRAKAENPAYTMIPDGVHPREAGQMLLAYAILKVLDAVTPASGVEIDAAHAQAHGGQSSVTELKACDAAISFSRTDDALPTYFPPDAIKAIGKYTTIFDEMNDYRLTATGLKPGKWLIKVEGKAVGTYTAEDLAKGVNLGGAAGPWLLLARKIDEQATYASHQFDIVFHGLGTRHFPQPSESNPAELNRLAQDIEVDRVAFIQKLTEVYEANEIGRGNIPAAERTWHWTLSRVD